MSAEGKAVWLAVSVTVLACLWTAQRHASLTDHAMRRELLNQAIAVAQTVSPSLVADLSFTKEDANHPAYQCLCGQLAAYKSLLGCRGIWSMALRDRTLIFGPESYPPDDPCASPAGTPYPKALPFYSDIFRTGRAFVSGPHRDEYGEFVFAVAPVLAPDTGKVIMTVGIDMTASLWHSLLIREQALACLRVFPLGLILIAGILLIRKRKRLPENLKGRLRYAEACTMALFSLALTALIAGEFHEREHIAQRNMFSQLAANQAYRLTTQFQQILDDFLSDVSEFYTVSKEVSRREFEAFVSPFLTQNGLSHIAWIERIRKEDRSVWETRARAEGYPALSIWEQDEHGNRKSVSGQRDVLFPVRHSAQHEGYGIVAGFDAGSEPTRRDALDQACKSGLPTATPPLQFFTSPTHELGIHVFKPVYKGSGASKTLIGLGLVAFRPEFLIKLTTGSMPPEASSSHITLFQLGKKADPPLYVAASETDSDTRISLSHLLGNSKNLRQVYPIFAFGRAYALICSPGEGFLSAYPIDPVWPILAAGLSIAGLLTLLTVLLTQHRRVLETEVQRRTKELRESENNYRMAEERERNLNKMLLAIRNVNQLIVREQGRDQLLEAICRNLTGTLGYFTAWIVLLDEEGSSVTSFTASGLDKDLALLRQQLADKKFPACMRAVLDGDKIFWTPPPAETCKEPYYLSYSRQDSTEMAARIEFKGHRFGVLVVSIPKPFAQDKLAVGLFAELADDLGCALHKLVTSEALQESETRFRSLVEGAPDAIFVYTDGKFAYLNKSAASLFGAANGEDLIGCPIINQFTPDDHESIRKRMREILEKKAPVCPLERTVVRPDGTTVAIESCAVPIRFRGLDGALVFVHNISERKQAEEQRRKLEERLNQSQKLESLGKLAGGVAHDFNNMLQVILGHVEMLLLDARDNSLDAEALREVRKAGQRAADLTRQLLAFARKQTIRPRPLDLNETVSDQLKMLRRLIGGNIDILWQPGTGLPHVKMDPAQITQIVTNLAVNARDAVSGNGSIIIGTSQKVISGTDRFDDNLSPGHYTVLSVRDNGCGMNKETLAHIFEPFFTTKSMNKGTGLGLSTVYGIVRQCNGYVNVTSEVGKGSTFRIYLPCCDEQVEDVKPEAEQDEPRFDKKTVLFVEDEPSLLTFGRKLLEKMGYTVYAASDPLEALHIAETCPEELHLLLTDVVMPNMSGRELQQKLLAQRPALKSLFMSGYTANAIAHHNVLDKGVHFLQKPFSSTELKAAILEALR